MKFKFFAMAFLAAVSVEAATAEPTQLVINVPREDFNPETTVSWKISAGTSNLNTNEGSITREGSGLGIGIEKIFTPQWSAGVHYTNIRAQVTDAASDNNIYKYTQSVSVFDVFGKFSFVNYSLNKWNQIQFGLMAGAMNVDFASKNIEPIYGAAAAYNYDNTIGIELNTKVNSASEAFSSANVVGYF